MLYIYKVYIIYISLCYIHVSVIYKVYIIYKLYVIYIKLKYKIYINDKNICSYC